MATVAQWQLFLNEQSLNCSRPLFELCQPAVVYTLYRQVCGYRLSKSWMAVDGGRAVHDLFFEADQQVCDRLLDCLRASCIVAALTLLSECVFAETGRAERLFAAGPC